MKVVHVTPYYAPELEFGGPPAAVHELCRALDRAGIGVRVVTTAADPRHEMLDRVPVTRVRRLTRLGFGAAMDGPLDEQLRDADVCHIHGLFNWPAWRAAACAERLSRPAVVSPRGMLHSAALSHHTIRKAAAWHLLDRRVMARAAKIVASSPGEANSVREHGFDAVVVPNGIDMPAALPSRGRFRSACGISTTARVITFLGRLHPIKRLDLVAGAFQQVAAHDKRAVLVIAGPDESDLWPEMRSSLGALADRVRRVGLCSAAEKWRVLVDTDALVLCSDSESHGRVVAEALAAGVPAVVARTCPWSVLEREGLGRWVPQTPGAIGSGLIELLSDDVARRAMGGRARAFAIANFGWDQVVSKYIAMYEAVIAQSANTPRRADSGVPLR